MRSRRGGGPHPPNRIPLSPPHYTLTLLGVGRGTACRNRLSWQASVICYTATKMFSHSQRPRKRHSPLLHPPYYSPTLLTTLKAYHPFRAAVCTETRLRSGLRSGPRSGLDEALPARPPIGACAPAGARLQPPSARCRRRNSFCLAPQPDRLARLARLCFLAAEGQKMG